MRIKPGVGSVVGQTDDTHWGQVLLSPQAYGIVEIRDTEGAARQKGVQLLSDLTETLAEGVDSLSKLASIVQSAHEKDSCTIALLVPSGHAAFVVLRGNGRVILKRGDKLATLVEGSGAISGELQQNDTLLLVSQGFLDVVSEAELLSAFELGTPQDIAERLTILLHKVEGGLGAAALVFQIQDMTSHDLNARSAAENLPPAAIPIAAKKKPFFSRFKRLMPLRSLVIGHDRQSRVLAILAVLAVILFAVSVILGIQKQAKGNADQKLAGAMKDARFAFDEGTALLELNAIRGRERLGEAKSLLDPFMATTSEKSPSGRELRILYKNITDNLTLAQKIFHITPEIFYDVSLLKNGAVAGAIAVREDQMGILDRPAGTVYAVELTTKSGAMTASGGDLAGAMYIAAGDDILYVETEKGIVAVDRLANKTKLVIPKPDEWKAIGGITVFDDNVYALDTGAGRIWKYVNSATGFSETREYLSPDAFPDLSHGSTMVIDGSVWVATTDGRILKFTQGKEDTFQVKGVEPAFGSVLRLTTDAASKYLYVLDTQGKRVVVLLKDGTYVAQYVWDQSMGIADFAVSEGLKRILLLSEGKIFAVTLQ